MFHYTWRKEIQKQIKNWENEWQGLQRQLARRIPHVRFRQANVSVYHKITIISTLSVHKCIYILHHFVNRPPATANQISQSSSVDHVVCYLYIRSVFGAVAVSLLAAIDDILTVAHKNNNNNNKNVVLPWNAFYVLII